MARPSNGQPRRSGPAIDEELERLWDLEQQDVGEIHEWCPICDGAGVIMEFGPTDCPNLDLHRMIDAALRPQLMSKREAAALIGVDPRSLNRHMALRRLPYQLIGKTAVFFRPDVVRFKRAYWY